MSNRCGTFRTYIIHLIIPSFCRFSSVLAERTNQPRSSLRQLN
jgi:hypothetical protein